MTPDRPALPAVLAHLARTDDVDLTEFWRVSLAPSKAKGLRTRLTVTDKHVKTDHVIDGDLAYGHIAPQRWTVATTADALERLVSAEVLPASFVGDESRRWTCGECHGKGRYDYDEEQGTWWPCRCDNGAVKEPETIPDLVAWASLGPATILRAEELVRDTARRLAPWGVALRPRRVVWRVGRVTPPAWWPHEANRPHGLRGALAHQHTERFSKAFDPSTGDHGWWAAHVTAWPEDVPPCPHEPMLELLTMGLALDAITDDALVVVVPPIGDTP